LKDIFAGFKQVMTIEINYSDDPDDPYITDENRRRGQLAWLLRAQTLVDVDCWTRVPGEPLRPKLIHRAILAQLAKGAGS
jgi:2-oxoglutarate ferredoxin oxidoreductase subunit alpha